MNELEILAKSDPRVTLKQHINEGLLVSKELKKCIPNVSQVDFWKILQVCVICHDIGKSHIEFQKMLLNKGNSWEYQRHELFSLPFIDNLQLKLDEIELVKHIVAGHHKDYFSLFKFMNKNYDNDDADSFGFDFNEDDKKKFETEFTENVPSSIILSLLRSYAIDCQMLVVNNPLDFLRKYLKNPINAQHKDFIKLLTISGAFKHCDHLSSSGITKLEQLELSDFSFLYSSKYEFYTHQKEASKSYGNVILTAPTGAGKTETSLLWLEKQIKEYGQGRVFYILPFTASINAMYERLNSDIEGYSGKVGLIHGKISEFIESKFSDDDYSLPKFNERKREILNSYKTLVKPLKVVTPFQLLKNIFGLKGFEKGMFEWLGGYFIFDEIHAYNPSVFAQIKVLLEFSTKYLNTKAFIMTATMPSFLKAEIKCAIENKKEIKANKKLYDDFNRHKVCVEIGKLTQNIELIQQQLNKEKKVLVVCNTVKNAQYVYSLLYCERKILLHSAFNSIDRNNKERELQSESNQLLVGTQAIEVSLDIDYDMIFTEPAPLDALIQRFGRVNRKRKKGIATCVVFEGRNKTDHFIYKNENVIRRTLEALNIILKEDDGIIKEANLQKYIDFVYPSWEDNDKKEFDRVYKYLNSFISEDLHPFMSSKMKEDEFYEQFDGVKVLPTILETKYIELVEQNKIVKAESLKVQISEKRFMQLYHSEGLSKERSVFEILETKKLKELSYFVVNRRYTSDLGLEIDVEENQELDCIIL